MDQMSARPRALDPSDWEALRRLRLDALLDAPDAFGSSYEVEGQREEGDWLWWIVGESGRSVVTTFALATDGELVGMATGAEFNEEPGTVHLFGMWVRPGQRGQGRGAALVHAVKDWATGRGAARVVLRVAEENADATRLYERCGFEPHPEDRLPLRDGYHVMTIAMEHALPSPPS
jgi:RimJ/RimL family protein N-acetyltransferase